MKSLTSVNNRLILEPYKNVPGIRTEIRGGLAVVSQKITLVPLKVLVSGCIGSGEDRRYVSAGAKAFFKEEFLKVNEAAKTIFVASDIEGDFIVLDASHVIFINEEYNIGQIEKTPAPTDGTIL